MSDKLYTAQQNRFGAVIVCGDDTPRKSYRIVFQGSYNDCLAVKFARRAAQLVAEGRVSL